MRLVGFDGKQQSDIAALTATRSPVKAEKSVKSNSAVTIPPLSKSCLDRKQKFFPLRE